MRCLSDIRDALACLPTDFAVPACPPHDSDLASKAAGSSKQAVCKAAGKANHLQSHDVPDPGSVVTSYATHCHVPLHKLTVHKHALPSIATLCVQRLRVVEPLTALTSLTLHSRCQVDDVKAPFSKLPNLRVALDTLDKAYHGEWWRQLKQLRTRGPNKICLGLPGLFPEGLEVLQLHSENPEPVTVTTGRLGHPAQPHPHQVRMRVTACIRAPFPLFAAYQHSASCTLPLLSSKALLANGTHFCLQRCFLWQWLQCGCCAIAADTCCLVSTF